MRTQCLICAILAIAVSAYNASPSQGAMICIYADKSRSVREVSNPGGIHEFTIYVFCQPNVNGLLCTGFRMEFPQNITQGEVVVNPAVDSWTGEPESGIHVCFEECQERWVWTHAQTLSLTDSLPSEMFIRGPYGGGPRFQNCIETDRVEHFYVCDPFLLNPREPDLEPPSIESVVDDGPLRVEVRLNECISPVEARNASRYEVFELENPTSTVPVESAVLLMGGRSVRLMLGDSLRLWESYTVRMGGLRDYEGNVMPSGTEEYFILTSPTSSSRMGLYLDEYRISNCVDGNGSYMFDMYVMCRPGEAGQMCAEFSIDYPENVIPLEIYPNDELIAVSMGDPADGISVCYRHCAMDWNCPFRQSILVADSSPTAIEIAPYPDTGESQFANCTHGYPTERIACISRILVNSTGHPLTLTGAHACSERTVILAFSKPVDDRTAEDVSCYELYEGGPGGQTVAIDEAILLGDRVNVNLRLRDELRNGHRYTVRIKGVKDRGGNTISTENECAFTFGSGPVETTPRLFALHQNFPNPFNPGTTITFHIPAASRVLLEIFDAAGRRIATLIDDDMEPGDHTAVWDGRMQSGVTVRSGVYFCRLRAGNDIAVRKMVLLE